MAERFQYSFVDYDSKNRTFGETIPAGVVRVLNENGAEGWELFKYEEVGDFVRLWLKRRILID